MNSAVKSKNFITDRADWRDAGRFSMSFQMVGLVLVLLIVCAVLVQVYSGVVNTSVRAEALNESVLLCRNAAELYSSNADLSETARRLGGGAENGRAVIFYDRSLSVTDAPEIWLTLTMTEHYEGDGLRRLDMAVTHGGAELYALSVLANAPEKGDVTLGG